MYDPPLVGEIRAPSLQKTDRRASKSTTSAGSAVPRVNGGPRRAFTLLGRGCGSERFDRRGRGRKAMAGWPPAGRLARRLRRHWGPAPRLRTPGARRPPGGAELLAGHRRLSAGRARRPPGCAGPRAPAGRAVGSGSPGCWLKIRTRWPRRLPARRAAAPAAGARIRHRFAPILASPRARIRTTNPIRPDGSRDSRNRGAPRGAGDPVESSHRAGGSRKVPPPRRRWGRRVPPPHGGNTPRGNRQPPPLAVACRRMGWNGVPGARRPAEPAGRWAGNQCGGLTRDGRARCGQRRPSAIARARLARL